MTFKFRIRVGILAAVVLTVTGAIGSAATAAPRPQRAEQVTLSPMQVDEVRRAIDEQRLLDAGQIIDRAIFSGVKDARLSLLSGELGLARGRLDNALRDFAVAEASPATSVEALQGKGIALARLGRTDDAIATLEKAVALSPDGWRGWNTLASQYDRRRDWSRAEAAYVRAMANSGGSPIVLNNRGYSRLLQSRYDEAVSDLVAALDKKPDLAAARTNLRLALAFKGDYSRSITGGPQEDRAALLNNAGFAAGVRGDYGKAEDLLGQAVKSRAQFYERASENLKLVQSLSAQSKAAARD
jgi:Flp pilus assembly protein TadD